jgi:glyoxalase family protein
MKLEGIHHVTAITADAPGNVDFYARVLGLRLVKKTVNQDDPTVYHLFYADEDGSAGADITFFEYPGARQGRAGAGMVHRVVFRVADDAALAFWADRLAAETVETRHEGDSLLFEDPEGLGLELRVVQTPDKPLVAISPDIPAEVALQGFDEVRAFTREPGRSRTFLEEVLGFEPRGEEDWEVRGEARGGNYVYDRAEGLGTPGAGTVHHVAFASLMAEHDGWEQRAVGTTSTTAQRVWARLVPARCTTLHSPRSWPSTTAGSSASPKRVRTLRRSSTASTSARSTSGSRAASSSRSPRSARASRSTSRSSRWARSCRCRPHTSTSATRSSLA